MNKLVFGNSHWGNGGWLVVEDQKQEGQLLLEFIQLKTERAHSKQVI